MSIKRLPSAIAPVMDSMRWRCPELFTVDMPTGKGRQGQLSIRQKERLSADKGKLQRLRRVVERQK